MSVMPMKDETPSAKAERLRTTMTVKRCEVHCLKAVQAAIECIHSPGHHIFT